VLGSLKILYIDILFFLVCLLGFISLIEKANLPFELNSSENVIKLTNDYYNLKSGDRLFSIYGKKVSTLEQIETLLDGKQINDKITIVVLRNNLVLNTSLILVPFYSSVYDIIILIIGSLFFILGLFVYYKGSDRKPSEIFHWGCVCTGSIILCTWGNYNYLPLYLGYITRFLFHSAYTLVPVVFLNFAFNFPIDRESRGKQITWIFYCTAILLALILNLSFIIGVHYQSISLIDQYLLLFNFHRIYFIVGVIASVTVFSQSYLMATSQSEKKKLKWLLFGFLVGPVCYIFLWILPEIFGIKFVPELFVILLMLAVPLSFAISILKYHLLDIDLVINRSIVYSIILIGLLIIYGSAIYIISDLVNSQLDKTLSSTIVVMVIAILFQPARTYVQKMVDKKFFRVQYDFRNTINLFLKEIKECSDINSLGKIVVNDVNTIFHIDKIAIVLINVGEISFLNGNGHLYWNFEEFKELILSTQTTTVYKNKLEPDVNTNYGDTNLFSKLGIVGLLLLSGTNQKILGFLVFGNKKSGQKYSVEDFDLLNTIASETGLTIDRILLQQKFIFEQMQKEKFEELDRMKSFFISSAAHELKTPLTSIKIYSELVSSDPGKINYLNIIDGECDRLSRLIDNLLDISRIERGEKKYELSPCSLNSVLTDALKLMEYQFKIEKCEVDYRIDNNNVIILMDNDSVISALINLFSNALKYSSPPKKITIKIFNDEGYSAISVTDNGIGIIDEEIQKIIEPYYRSTMVRNKNFIGTGIGLALVKHTMEAHKGSIKISSSKNGSTFTLYFPIMHEQEQHEESTVS
jgi:signal transduction histidine kinase